MGGAVLWGTSTWTYEGWDGLVYRDVAGYGKSFKRDCLGEYAASGRFGCVGLDASFYRPPPPAELAHWAALLPPRFPTVVKVWQDLTAPFYTAHFGPPGKAGKSNPRFLDAATFDREFLPPFRAAFREHVGAFVLELPLVSPERLAPEALFARLDAFLGAIEPGWPMAVEVRSRWWLTPRYVDVLARRGAAHAFNVWTHMPLPDEVAERLPGLLETAPFAVCRALVAPGTAYAAAVERFRPYTHLQAVDPKVRDSLVRFARRALEHELNLYMAINNRLEGCAPLTVDELRRLVEPDADHPPRLERRPREAPPPKPPKGRRGGGQMELPL